MRAEFKEKTFETAFIGELRLMTNIVYAPDQCDEGFLGFDGAVFLPWEYLREFVPYVRFRRWRHLTGMAAADIDDFGKELNNRLPTFRLNLFVQFKRPEHLARVDAAEWSFWNRNYFRYRIGKKQQLLLEKILARASGRAVAIYAVPAFHKSADLFTHQIHNAVIKNSNVISAGLLTGHSRCTFVEDGTVGKGHSDPKDIEGPTLETLLAETEPTDARSFTRHVKDAAALIGQLFEDDEDSRVTLNLAKQAILGGDIADVFPRASDTWVDAVLTMMAFSSAFGIRVCAIG